MEDSTDTAFVATGISTAEPGTPAVEVKNLDCLGVLSELWDELGFTDVVNAHVTVDDQVELQPGQVLKALVLNIVGGRSPLYRVAQWAERVPLDVVVGGGVRAEQLNDTTLARHLDRLFDAGPEGVFNAACIRVIETEGVSLDRLHGDTTSRLVFGEYRLEEDDAISITRGHSKDKRPDLKQVMYGVTTSVDGVPVIGQLLSGNTSDKKWHGGMLDIIQRRYVVDRQRSIHYVGDSALVTESNFTLAAEHGIVLSSRLPRTIGLTDTVVLRAVYEPLAMEDIGTFSESKRATRYEACVVRDCVLFGRPVQLGIFRPTPANERTRSNVLRRREKALKAARKTADKLARSAFACRADAEEALMAFETAHLDATHADRLLTVAGEIALESCPGKRPRGRPASDSAPPPDVSEYRIRLTIDLDDDNTEAMIARESCFVLVHTGAEPTSAREMMTAYKGQAVVEKRFPFLKDPAWAEVFFLKTPHRVEALGYVLLLALLLWSVWERRVRANLKHSGEPPLVDTTGMKKANPTAAVCRHILHDIKLVRMHDGHTCTPWRLAGALTEEQKRVARFSRAPPMAKEGNRGAPR